MRALLLFVAVIGYSSSNFLFAGELHSDIAAARRQLEIAQLKQRIYENDEYPRLLSEVERAIEMAKAELESFKRRVIELEHFEEFVHSPPFFLSREEARLDVLRGDLRLRSLEDERFRMLRTRGDRVRLYQLEIDAAAAQLNALIQKL